MDVALTTPHTKGLEVTRLQKALKAKNWLEGAVDGEFGPDTARAVKRAKYWLGYRKPDKRASDLLMSYLSGKSTTPAMKLRAANRRRIAKQKPVRLKMWDEAQKHIGVKEHPAGTNRCRFSLWYGLIGAWCAMFVTWDGVVAKSKAFRRGKYYAYVPYVVADARRGVNNLAVTYFPQQGDLVCFDWGHDGVADHIGLFGAWTKEKGTFTTVEGNTGIGNDSNGGEVMRRTRNKSQVICFVHVGK